MASVLVTDGEERSALAVVRSLGRAGHDVIVGARRRTSLSGASKFASGAVELPDPLAGADGFADAVGTVVRQRHCDIVLPVTDASALAVLGRPAVVQPAIIPLPALERFLRASDKGAVAEAARGFGIRVPRQVRVERRDDPAGLHSGAGLVTPLVLKPARSVTGDPGHRAKHQVVHAADWSAVERLVRDLPDGAFPLLVQERIVGPGIGVFLLLWQGTLVAAFAHRRVREKPPAGGVSVLCESIALDPGLLSRSEALLRSLDWSGVAMIEYKQDAASGEAVLMEVNGRFWGSLQLAVDAGVDFPRLLLACASGESPAPVTSYAVGVRSRWWWGDVDHLLLRMSRSKRALDLPPGAPGRARVLGDFIAATFASGRDQVFQRDDPKPAVRETLDWFRDLL